MRVRRPVSRSTRSTRLGIDVLAPESTPGDVVAALRSHVFALFLAPFEPAEVVTMVQRAADAEDWRDGITVVAATHDWISLCVAPRRLTAERLVVFVDGFLAEQPDDQRARLVLASCDILRNAMEHGADMRGTTSACHSRSCRSCRRSQSRA